MPLPKPSVLPQLSIPPPSQFLIIKVYSFMAHLSSRSPPSPVPFPIDGRMSARHQAKAGGSDTLINRSKMQLNHFLINKRFWSLSLILLMISNVLLFINVKKEKNNNCTRADWFLHCSSLTICFLFIFTVHFYLLKIIYR